MEGAFFLAKKMRCSLADYWYYSISSSVAFRWVKCVYGAKQVNAARFTTADDNVFAILT